jgi:P27 family predicted phage terminase small subunit
MKGRPPKPTALHKLHGTYERSRHDRRAGEPKPEGDLDRPPKGLTPSQRAAWRYAIAHAPRGLLKRIDRGVLLVWIEAECRHRQAMKEIAKDGLVIYSAEGEPHLSPYNAILNATARTLLRAAAELGFSPVSRPRIRISAEPPPDDPADPWAMLRLVPGCKPGPAPAA